MNIVSYNRCCPARSVVTAAPRSDTPKIDIKGDSFKPSTGNSANPIVLSTSQAPTAREAVAAATRLVQTTSNEQPGVDIKDVQTELTNELPEVKVRYLHTDGFGDLNGQTGHKSGTDRHDRVVPRRV